MRALDLFDEMLRCGIAPDAWSYNLPPPMHCLFRSGHPEDAYRVFADMAEKGVAPCAATYNTLLDGLFRAGHATNAYRMFRYLQRVGLPIGIVTYKLQHDDQRAVQVRQGGRYARMVLKELGRAEHAPNVIT
ncbi:hypothetical protein EJB05_29045, partial [Eragrostis curvula]